MAALSHLITILTVLMCLFCLWKKLNCIKYIKWNSPFSLMTGPRFSHLKASSDEIFFFLFLGHFKTSQ